MTIAEGIALAVAKKRIQLALARREPALPPPILRPREELRLEPPRPQPALYPVTITGVAPSAPPRMPDRDDPQPDATMRSFVMPVSGRVRVSSAFNPKRMHPVLHVVRPHHGVDLAAPEGTPVLAAWGGVVTHAGPMRGYGNTVTIDHAGGRQTLYAHLQSVSVAIGISVRAGDQIGLVGRTGLATGPHLHWGLYIDGRAVNPMAEAA